jgi:hypothetical protein
MLSCTSMNEVKNAMMFAHGRSFFLYSRTAKSCLTKVHNEYLEIDTLLKKHPHSRPVHKGVYARNRLPRLLNVPSALVGNTDPDHRMGQHWVAIYIDANSRGEYYDPTGRPPHKSAYVNFMNKHCLHWAYRTTLMVPARASAK